MNVNCLLLAPSESEREMCVRERVPKERAFVPSGSLSRFAYPAVDVGRGHRHAHRAKEARNWEKCIAKNHLQRERKFAQEWRYIPLE